jgi:hypothetical protein
MEPNEEHPEIDKKAECLAKRRERRRQRLLEETADGRETCLGKRREAWKKRLPRQKVSKRNIRESVIGNRKKLEKVPRKEKLAWQNEEKCGKKGLQKLKVSKKSIRECII